jgi:hypothetical protein
MSVIRHKLDRVMACNCGSAAVIDTARHDEECTRRLWREFCDEIDSSNPRGAVDALDEAIKAARLFNRGGMTWREYDRLLVRLGGVVNHARGQ